MEPLAVRLAEAVAVRYRAGLPARILNTGRDLLLNAAAGAIAGREHPGWKTLSSAGKPGTPGEPGASQIALLFAAAAAAAAASVHDSDDGPIATVSHPSGVNMGAALGASSLAPVTGRDFLTAFLLGCETELRFARALTPEAPNRGWDLDGVCGPLSAAITAALLLGAGPGTLGNAVGIAASSTAGHRSGAGSLLGVFVAGKAAANGVTAALLSRQGFTASPGALDSPRGLGSALVQRPGVFGTVTDGFGTEWLLDGITLRDQRHDGVAGSLAAFLSAIDEQPDVRSLMTATCG
jgi:2-methylcitrate dehydratase PrpD